MAKSCFLHCPALPKHPISFMQLCPRPSPRACAANNTPSPAIRRRPRNYYSNYAALEHELLEFTQGQLRVPSSRELRSRNRRDLENAIARHGGFVMVANKLGWARLSKRKAHKWWTWERLVKEIRDISGEGENALMPTGKLLKETGKGDLAAAIARFGGFAEVSEKLGLRRVGGRRKGWWKEFGNLETELRKFLEERASEVIVVKKEGEAPAGVGKIEETPNQESAQIMPTQRELRNAGRSDLATAILAYHGGFPAVAKRLGLVSTTRNKNYWKEFYNLASELYNYVHTAGDRASMPSQEELRKNKRTDLISAIHYHGGMSRVARNLGLNYVVRRREPFRNWNIFRRQILAFTERHGISGVLPTQRQLRNFGRNDLYQAILHHGGPQTVAERIGLRTVSHWNDFYYVGRQVLEFVENHGIRGMMPSEQDFKDIGRNSLNVLVSKFGYSHVAKRLGLRQRTDPQQKALDTIVSAAINRPTNEDDYKDVVVAHISVNDLL